jgi:hypothetical protein
MPNPPRPFIIGARLDIDGGNTASISKAGQHKLDSITKLVLFWSIGINLLRPEKSR